MDIEEACNCIRQWNDFFTGSNALTYSSIDLIRALRTVKHHLERGLDDGNTIHELEIGDHLLLTRAGVRHVMPFVLAVEAMAARERTTQLS